MELKQSQQIVFDQILEEIRAGTKRIKLIGSAGTGKTTLVSILIEQLLKQNMFKSVFVTAPTNKALAVLMGKIHIDSKYLQFKTIHSALKLTRYINPKTGAVSFVQGKSYNTAKLEDFRFAYICIVDECSMLNSQLIDLLDKYDFPIIYVGC